MFLGKERHGFLARKYQYLTDILEKWNISDIPHTSATPQTCKYLVKSGWILKLPRRKEPQIF